MTTEEAAQFLRLGKRTLDNMRWRGEGPKYRKHGGRIRYHIDRLKEWSERRENDPPKKRPDNDDDGN